MKIFKRIIISTILSCALCVAFFGKTLPYKSVIAHADTCNHSYEWQFLTAPTRLGSGYASYKCVHCQSVKPQVGAVTYGNLPVPALSDIAWTEITALSKEPSFIATGVRVFHYESPNGAGTIVYTYVLPTLSALDYTLTFAEGNAPTAENSGFLTYEFKRGDEFKQKESQNIAQNVAIPALSDLASWSKTEKIAPTCQIMGVSTYTYRLCNAVTVDVQDVPTVAHDGVWQVTTAPTRTTAGTASQVCQHSTHLGVLMTQSMPVIPETLVSNDNYVYVQETRASLSAEGVGRFYLRNGESYYQTLYVEVELPKLVIDHFAVVDGDLVLFYTDGSTDNLGTVQGASGADGANGTNGKDGADGVNGINGKDGVNGEKGADGADGKDGANGVNGINGKDGVNGENGADGKSFIALNVVSVTLSSVSVLAVAVLLYLLIKSKKISL